MEKANNQEEYKRPIPESIRKRRYGEDEEKTVVVETRTLTSCWRSKEDIYKYLNEQKQVFLPSKRGCTIAFLRQILAGEKKYFQQQEIRLFQVPQYEELSVKNLYPKIIGTLHFEWLKKVIDEALRHRNTKSEEEEKGQFVVVTEKLFNDIKNDNFISKKPGKGVYLLQKKILKRKMLKSRQKYELAAHPEEILKVNSLQRKHINQQQTTVDNTFQSISNLSIKNQETDDDMITGI